MTTVDWRLEWLDDAPEPEQVSSRVLALIARRVKLLSERQLRYEDHADAMALVVTADSYYDLFSHLVMYYPPDTAAECCALHKDFAQRMLSVHLDEDGDSPEVLAELTALASRCNLSRGGVCPNCRLPMVIHATQAPGGAPADIAMPKVPA